jgi:hypothetical protein
MSKTRTWKISESRKHEGWFVVIGPKDDDFIADLKAAVPAAYREWNGDLRAWLVHGDFIEDVRRIVAAHTITAEPPAPPAPPTAHELPGLAAVLGEAVRDDQAEDIRAGVMAGAEAVSDSIGLAPSAFAARKITDGGKRPVARDLALRPELCDQSIEVAPLPLQLGDHVVDEPGVHVSRSPSSRTRAGTHQRTVDRHRGRHARSPGVRGMQVPRGSGAVARANDGRGVKEALTSEARTRGGRRDGAVILLRQAVGGAR